jgi:hypothetical protein
MRRSPSIVPDQDDRDVYLVLDDLGGRLGRAWRETDEESTDRRVLITDLLDGQYSNPARIAAFNTAEGWSRDVSEEIADEIARDALPTTSTISRTFHRPTRDRPTGAVALAATRT